MTATTETYQAARREADVVARTLAGLLVMNIRPRPELVARYAELDTEAERLFAAVWSPVGDGVDAG